MAHKKIVFVLVEGPSDSEALELLLSKLFDPNQVFIYIAHYDITTENGVTSSNILIKLGDIIKKYASSNHFNYVHFQEYIHIVDMDGAYVPDDSIIYNEDAKKPLYLLTKIETNNVEGISDRNNRKRQCLERLSITDTIWRVPYQVYYMSTNLDHVLYNKLNTSDKEKEIDAYNFALKYKDNIKGFVDYICESDFSVCNGYPESWNFIKQKNHSLERYSNFGICIKRSNYCK